MKIYIYTLEHPETGEIRYIGKTSNIKRRYYQHTNTKVQKKATSHLSNWLKKLINENKKPLISILEECEYSEWVEREMYWIAQFKTWGFNLVNGSNGGDGSKGFELSEKHKLKICKSRIKKCPNTGELMHTPIDFKTSAKIKEDILKGERCIDVAKKYNTTKYTVYLIKSGKKFPKSGSTIKIETKKIGQYDLNNNLLKIFDTIRHAANEVNVTHEMIRCCLKKPDKYKTCKKFIWKFIN
jgi:group I intron endonuclease